MATLTRSALPLPPPGAASNTAASGTAPISSQSLSALSANDDLVVYMSAMAIASSGPHTIVNVSSSVPTHAALRDSFLHLQELCMGGFELLIEHEWVAYGHPFSTRCGHITRQAADESEGASSPAPGTESWAKKPSWLPLTPNSAPSDADHAPYFLLFLDCVHQIMTQYPLSFEMTEKYLITLCDAMWACLFGTFVSNSDKDRVDSSMESRTVPVWAHMHIVLEQDGVDMEFLNPAFVGPQSLPASSHSQPASTMINAMNGMFELMPDLHIEVTPPATAAAAASSVSSTAPSGKHARVEESFITPPPMPYVQRCPITSHTDASVGAPLALTPQGEGLLLNFWDVNYLRWVPHVRPAFVDVAFTSALYHTRELVHEVAQLERQRQRLQRLLAERTTAV
ncbi:hypothetical protein CAOG_02747 [Capsaspora owczarzaki ATCC 30864]|uniref:hypothetical protein n=1 Tax=Capsaspora owczarzaki (strain ATCC 30864) TaxID=595528 RepID=UPI0003521A50|nr:hypothetical protein CAOG_02747 [Capsaspora owczarzaki ATCC 30864]|eukprot:XP_004349497.2 hypothetical protein CAOG_02747 [Capsaspora owczarzaki ATCC 30864]